MQELFDKTKELEDLVLGLGNVVSEYTKIIMKIEEIHFLQLKIETKSELDSSIKNEYDKWKKEKLNLIFWLIRLGKYFANLKNQGTSLTDSENNSLKNLIQFLTKYNYICQENTDEDIKEKIEMQINNLFQNIFKTDKKLIKSKDIVTKIVPYFTYEVKNFDNHNYFKDSFTVDLTTKLYVDEDLQLASCCYYNPSLPRKISAILVNDGSKNRIINNEEELAQLENYQIIGFKALCMDVVEGWYKLTDIKFI